MKSNSFKRSEVVRSSRSGHNFHECWTARRALGLLFQQDDLMAMSIEGFSTEEEKEVGESAQEIADLVLYYGGDNFLTSSVVQVVQFKYRCSSGVVTASYLGETLEKFADTLLEVKKLYGEEVADKKLKFLFVTNAKFTESLYKAIEFIQKRKHCALDGLTKKAFIYFEEICQKKGVDITRFFECIDFQTCEKDLSAQRQLLKKRLTSWSVGQDFWARQRLNQLIALVVRKANTEYDGNNLVRDEDVLGALECNYEDLFPAESRFVHIENVIEREAVKEFYELLQKNEKPIVVLAEGGAGKTVFVQSLASKYKEDFEFVLFDCFAGGAYRAKDQARHLAKYGIRQIINEFASRGLCDPLIPTETSVYEIIKTFKKRLDQIVETIKLQSSKKGAVILIDAADNAQIEADQRGEKAFPSLLLESLSREPVPGVKLVLTARPERIGQICKTINCSDIFRFKLEKFSRDEAKEFILRRLPNSLPEDVEKAVSRSTGSPRVLEYLVTTWESNVRNLNDQKIITTEEIIEKQCLKVSRNLTTLGWTESQIEEYFTALALFPLPVPLEELAQALDWDLKQIYSASTDLMPMLEILPNGAIFRDEPTESYIRRKYSERNKAQEAIAERLLRTQRDSLYVAEALPNFLLTTQDSEKLYELASSNDFPESILTEYDRYHLKSIRLSAAFKMSLLKRDFDKLMVFASELAQITMTRLKANFVIRNHPDLSALLGGSEIIRNLLKNKEEKRDKFAAKLAVVYAFVGEIEEAKIYYFRAKKNILDNGIVEFFKDFDFDESGNLYLSGVLFIAVIIGNFNFVDTCLSKYDFDRQVDIVDKLFEFVNNCKVVDDGKALAKFIRFICGEDCKSDLLRLYILSCSEYINEEEFQVVFQKVNWSCLIKNVDRKGYINEIGDRIIKIVFIALSYGLKWLIGDFIKCWAQQCPLMLAKNDYKNLGRCWREVILICLQSWVNGECVEFDLFVPKGIGDETKILINSKEELFELLTKVDRQDDQRKNDLKFRHNAMLYCYVINNLKELVGSFEENLLKGQKLDLKSFVRFLQIWNSQNQSVEKDVWNAPLIKQIYFKLALWMLEIIDNVEEDQVKKLIRLLSSCFNGYDEKLKLLDCMSRREDLHELVGDWANKLAEEINKKDNIDCREELYLQLSSSMLSLGVNEAREYFRECIKSVKGWDGADEDTIFLLLDLAIKQKGGCIRPQFANQLMRVCENVVEEEKDDIRWEPFSLAMANSVGVESIYRVLQWYVENKIDYSITLPHLAINMALSGNLDPRRAVLLWSLPINRSLYEWRSGDWLEGMLQKTRESDRSLIYNVVRDELIGQSSIFSGRKIWDALNSVRDSIPELLIKRNDDYLERKSQFARKIWDMDEDRFKLSEEAEPGEDSQNLFDNEDILLDQNKEKISSLQIAMEQVEEVTGSNVNNKYEVLARLFVRFNYKVKLLVLEELSNRNDLRLSDISKFLCSVKPLLGGATRNINGYLIRLIELLIGQKGQELFTCSDYEMFLIFDRLSDFCGSRRTIIMEILQFMKKDPLTFEGESWIRVLILLCEVVQPETNKVSLEKLLSGADVAKDDCNLTNKHMLHNNPEAYCVASVLWLLLGDSNEFVRWQAARCIKTLIDLNLTEDLDILFAMLDKVELSASCISYNKISYFSSRQWLLIGIARAALYHGSRLKFLVPRLLSLLMQEDMHLINKIEVRRSLQNILKINLTKREFKSICKEYGIKKSETCIPQFVDLAYFDDFGGVIAEVVSFSDFTNVPISKIYSMMRKELKRYCIDQQCEDSKCSIYSNYGFGCEEFERQILLNAASKILKKLLKNKDYVPGNREKYPYHMWLQQYDLVFDDGSFLSDHKDLIPEYAHAWLLAPGAFENDGEFEETEFLLQKLCLTSKDLKLSIPLYGKWNTFNDMSVQIMTLLLREESAERDCELISKDINALLNSQSHGSLKDIIFERSRVFPSFVKLKKEGKCSVGIDIEDRLATRLVLQRTHLTKAWSKKLELTPDIERKKWITKKGTLAIESIVWGEQLLSGRLYVRQIDLSGEVLKADARWLMTVLQKIKRRLALIVILERKRERKTLPNKEKVFLMLLDSEQGGKFTLW